MYLKSLVLRNVRQFADQRFDFTRDGERPRMWTVILGDNATGKTTLLQSIALASSGEKLARKLVDDAADYVNLAAPELGATIAAEFTLDGRELSVELSVPAGGHAFRGDEGSAVLDDDRDQREPGRFVVGYGIGRRLPRPGEAAVSRDPLHERLIGLFDSHHKMLGTDFYAALEQLDRSDTNADRALALKFSAELKEVLLARDDGGAPLFPQLADFELRGKGGVKTMESLLESRRMVLDAGDGSQLRLPIHLLSAGYQSTFAWLADLLGQGFVDAGEPIRASALEGVVLLDEVDLHLHPTWQRRIVPVLRSTFPRLQFIVTTHSPLVLTGFEQSEIIGLGLEGGKIIQRATPHEPAAQTATQLLSTYFDVPHAARPQIVEAQRRLRRLLAQSSRTAAEDEALRRLEAELVPYASDDLAAAPYRHALDEVTGGRGRDEP